MKELVFQTFSSLHANIQQIVAVRARTHTAPTTLNTEKIIEKGCYEVIVKEQMAPWKRHHERNNLARGDVHCVAKRKQEQMSYACIQSTSR